MIYNMEFDCRLAHQNVKKRISGFNSIKQLYTQASRAFSISVDDILFCTLNTDDYSNMDSLIGNQLSNGDLIVVHLCGDRKQLNLYKTDEYLGLTITDNGNGKAFVKKVKSRDSRIEKAVKPGQHIAAINSHPTLGKRHYEVAQIIRSIPQQSLFVMIVVEPLQRDQPNKARLHNKQASQDNNHVIVNNRDNLQSPQQDSTPQNTFDTCDSMLDEMLNYSLPIDKLLSKQITATGDSSQPGINNESQQDMYRSTIEKINTILESFLGINDNVLAVQIYRQVRESNQSYDKFDTAITSSGLNVFNFDEDTKKCLWDCATAD